MNRNQAHYHPDLNEPCAHGEPLVRLPGGLVVEEGRWPLLSIVGLAVALLVVGVLLWLALTSLG